MPEFAFEVYCSCGNGLCGQTVVRQRGGYVSVIVEPCEKCMAQAKEDGDYEGYQRGKQEAEEEEMDNEKS